MKIKTPTKSLDEAKRRPDNTDLFVVAPAHHMKNVVQTIPARIGEQTHNFADDVHGMCLKTFILNKKHTYVHDTCVRVHVFLGTQSAISSRRAGKGSLHVPTCVCVFSCMQNIWNNVLIFCVHITHFTCGYANGFVDIRNLQYAVCMTNYTVNRTSFFVSICFFWSQ